MFDKKILFVSSDTSGCGWYRTKLISDFLQQDHCWLFPAHKNSDGSMTLKDERVFNADVIVIQRHNHEFFLQCIPYLQSIGKKVVYDLDDNLWHIPVTSPAHKGFPTDMLKQTKKIIQLCDYVTVSTEPLKNWLYNNGFNKNIVVIPNMLEDVLPYIEKDDSRIRIGYSGSPTHVGDFSYKLIKALRELQKRDDCELVFMGYNPLKNSEVEFHKGVEVKDYLQKLNSLNLDIAIAPLDNNLFNQCKSNLKFLEYSACGISTIASDVYPYSKTITNNSNGIIVSDDKYWLSYFNKLIANWVTRKIHADQAYYFVQQNYTYRYAGQLIVDKWEQILKEMYVNS